MIRRLARWWRGQEACGRCRGGGEIYTLVPLTTSAEVDVHECPDCDGSGVEPRKKVDVPA